MTQARLVRAATIAVFLAVVVAVVVRFFPDTNRTTKVEPRSDETSVELAIATAITDPIVVRGYVFDGPGSLPLRLCHGLEDLDPVQCLGPYLVIEGVDQSSFALDDASDDGDRFSFQKESVSLRGVISGTTMRVEQVLQ